MNISIEGARPTTHDTDHDSIHHMHNTHHTHHTHNTTRFELRSFAVLR